MDVNTNAHGKAVASLVLGIIACVTIFTGPGTILGLILAIIGVVEANQAKAAGNTEGIRTAGFVLSVVGIAVCVIALAIIVLSIGLLGVLGIAMA